ncbi:hypothetical protein AMTRI_Chr06g190900 [Amborella trichopoda]
MEITLKELKDSRIQCSEKTFIVVIRNYGFANKPKMALRSFFRVNEFGINKSIRSFNTLLNAMIQTKRFDLVHTLYKNSRKLEIFPNVFTCNILIKALCQINDLESAFRVLEEMPSQGFVPNPVTYITILSGFCACGDLIRAKRIFDEIITKGWVPDPVTYTIIIDGFCKNGRLMEAVKLMDDMEDNRVLPNDVTYGVVIASYYKEGRSGEALSLLNEMLEKKFILCPTLCCKIVDLLCQEGKVDEACVLWKKLLKRNCTPDNGGKLRQARKLFDEFEKGFLPSILTYNTLISAMCENGELQDAGRLWVDMLENGWFSITGRESEGFRVLEDMLTKGGKDDIMKLLVATTSRGFLLDLDSWGSFVDKVINDREGWKCSLGRI